MKHPFSLNIIYDGENLRVNTSPVYPEKKKPTKRINRYIRFDKPLQFSESPFRYINDASITEFDVVFDKRKKCKEGVPHLSHSEICINCYFWELTDKMIHVPRLKRRRFLDHQCSLRNDPVKFLEELEEILIDYEDQFDKNKFGLATDYLNLIKVKRSASYPSSTKTISADIVDMADVLNPTQRDQVISQYQLPENFSLTAKGIKAERLDKKQAAILFYLLRQKKAIINYSDQDLAKFAHYLTGHSEQNIRTKDGFSAINDIMDETRDGETYYNLKVLRNFLEELIAEINSKIK